jgi:hypothetical protein
LALRSGTSEPYTTIILEKNLPMQVGLSHAMTPSALK